MKKSNDPLIIIGSAALICFSIFFFLDSMKYRKTSVELQGEKNILLKQKKELEDTIDLYIAQADSMAKVFSDLQISWNEDKIKFNEKLSKAKRNAYSIPADSATVELTGLIRLEQRQDSTQSIH